MMDPFELSCPVEIKGKHYVIRVEQNTANPNGAVIVLLGNQQIGDKHEALPWEDRAELLNWGKRTVEAHAEGSDESNA